MLTIFNRKELCITYSLEEQANIRNILCENQIDYQIKTVNRRSPSPVAAGTRARTGTFGENPGLAYEYIIYVKKDDYEKASHVIS